MKVSLMVPGKKLSGEVILMRFESMRRPLCSSIKRQTEAILYYLHKAGRFANHDHYYVIISLSLCLSWCYIVTLQCSKPTMHACQIVVEARWQFVSGFPLRCTKTSSARQNQFHESYISFDRHDWGDSTWDHLNWCILGGNFELDSNHSITCATHWRKFQS